MHNDTWLQSPPTRVGLHAFDAILRHPEIRTPQDALFHSHQNWPSVFADAQEILRPPGWRLLRCGPTVRWALLCDASTDARDELTRLAAVAATEGVPPAWLDGLDPGDVAAGVQQDLADADPDEAKAAFLIVGFVQFIQLDPSTVIAWWEQRLWLNLLLPR